MRFFLFLFALVFGLKASALEVYVGTIVSTPSGTVKNNLTTAAPFTPATGRVVIQCDRDAWMNVGTSSSATTGPTSGIKLLKDAWYYTELLRNQKVIAVVDVTVAAGNLNCKVFEVKEVTASKRMMGPVNSPGTTANGEGIPDPLSLDTLEANTVISSTVATGQLDTDFINGSGSVVAFNTGAAFNDTTYHTNVSTPQITTPAGGTSELLIAADGARQTVSAGLGACSSGSAGRVKVITVNGRFAGQVGAFICDGQKWMRQNMGQVLTWDAFSAVGPSTAVAGDVINEIFPSSTDGQLLGANLVVRAPGTCSGACPGGSNAEIRFSQGATTLCRLTVSCTAAKGTSSGIVACAGSGVTGLFTASSTTPIRLTFEGPCTTFPSVRGTLSFDTYAVSGA